jgi:hypothetical protein
MGRPTSMSYAYSATTVLILCNLFQSRHLAFSFIYGYLLLVFAQ